MQIKLASWLATAPSVIIWSYTSWHQIALIAQQSLLPVMTHPEGIHLRLTAETTVHDQIDFVESGHLTVTQVMCSCCTSKSWKSADGINKGPTVLSNQGFLIYLNHCACIKADYLQNGPERAWSGLHVEYLRLEVHQKPLIKLRITWCDLHHLMPLAPIVGRLSLLMASSLLWADTGQSSNCFPIDLQPQPITDPW